MSSCLSKLWKLPAHVLFVLFVVAVNPCTAWQNDPFDPFATDETEVQDAADQSTGSPAGLPPIEDSLSDGVRLVLRSLREANPTKPVELARAVRATINVRQYGEAKIYLNKLIDLSLTDQQLFELMNQVGPDFFLEVRGQNELQPEGSAFALKAFESSRKAAFAPGRINQLVQQLSDEDQYNRAEATRSLKQIGAPAAAEMLNQCAGGENKKQAPFIPLSAQTDG